MLPSDRVWLVGRGGEPEKRLVQRSFGRAAPFYDSLAALQRSAAGLVFDSIPDEAAHPARILDLGTGTGYCLGRLVELFPGSEYLAVDLAEGMLHQLRRRNGALRDAWLLAGDAERLPIADCSMNLITSNLAFQWCSNLDEAIGECARILVPGGRLVFTSFGVRTLWELREAWSAVDDLSHVNRFSDEQAVKHALNAAGLVTHELRTELRVVSYPDVFALMRELKGLGAQNVTAGRRRSLTGKERIARMAQQYQARHPWPHGGIGASFELVLGTATRPNECGSGKWCV